MTGCIRLNGAGKRASGVTGKKERRGGRRRQHPLVGEHLRAVRRVSPDLPQHPGGRQL
jgi:hypothetical protein